MTGSDHLASHWTRVYKFPILQTSMVAKDHGAQPLTAGVSGLSCSTEGIYIVRSFKVSTPNCTLHMQFTRDCILEHRVTSYTPSEFTCNSAIFNTVITV